MSSTAGLNLFELRNPLVAHHVTLLRDPQCRHNQYRRIVRQLYRFIAYEALSVLQPPIAEVEIEGVEGRLLLSDRMAIVAVLRGGIVAAEAVQELFPRAPTAHVASDGAKGGKAKIAYEKFPDDFGGRHCFVLEPRIETGSTSRAVLEHVRRAGIEESKIVLLNIICAPEGLANVYEHFPQVSVVTASVEKGLVDGDLVPGVGKVGDRVFETQMARNREG